MGWIWACLSKVGPGLNMRQTSLWTPWCGYKDGPIASGISQPVNWTWAQPGNLVFRLILLDSWFGTGDISDWQPMDWVVGWFTFWAAGLTWRKLWWHALLCSVIKISESSAGSSSQLNGDRTDIDSSFICTEKPPEDVLNWVILPPIENRKQVLF